MLFYLNYLSKTIFNWISSTVQDLRRKISQGTRATLAFAWCVTLAISPGIMEYLSAVIIHIGYFWLDVVNYARIQWALMAPSHLSLLLIILIALKVSCTLIERYNVVFNIYFIISKIRWHRSHFSGRVTDMRFTNSFIVRRSVAS